MRLKLILPKVEPTQLECPKKCPRQGCPGKRFIPRQEVGKKMVDAQPPEVTAWRYECTQYGMVLSIDELAGQEAEQLQAWLEPILDAVEADVVVSGDADAFKKVSDATGRAQQVCKKPCGSKYRSAG